MDAIDSERKVHGDGDAAMERLRRTSAMSRLGADMRPRQRLNLRFDHERLDRDELAALKCEYGTADHYDWNFYKRWFGYRPSDAPEHIEMDAIIEREIGVSETVLAGGIPWNLEFASEPRQTHQGWYIMLKGAPGYDGYSFGVTIQDPRGTR